VKALTTAKAAYLDAQLDLARAKEVLGQYYQLIKPRIELLIMCSTAVGYCYGVAGHFRALTFLNVLLGTGPHGRRFSHPQSVV
jgi:heme O synthase-like polyprenyltransferase